MIKKSLLILNGSHSEIPLIKAGKNLGFHVITTGNNPSLIGHNYSDEYHLADYSNREEILALAKTLDIDYICSCANDFGAITASFVAEKMALAGHDNFATTLLLHQKDFFKQFSIQHAIPTPYAKCFDDEKQALESIEKYIFPVIIKPVDLTGGKGVQKANKTTFVSAVKNSFKQSVEKRIVVEDFFSGTQHSLSSFLINQKVQFSFSDNEYSYLNPYYVSSSAAPASNIEQFKPSLVKAVEKIAEQLQLKDGIFHIQYLANKNEAKIIDITRRCSGDMYPYPVNYSTNIDWAEWIVKAECGIDCSNFPQIKQLGFYGRYCVMGSNNGRIKKVLISNEIKKNIYDELFWWKQGDVIDSFMTQKIGIVFLKFNSMEQMLNITKKLPKLIQVETVQLELT